MTDRLGITPAQQAVIERVERWGAHNYLPLPVVIESGQGAWLTDIDGNRYLDFLSAYSAVNFGHSHPVLVRALQEQLSKLAITSRAVFSATYGPFIQALAELCGKEMVLPMNTGVEAVESAIKIARKWGYEVKGVEERRANIIVMENNFHGRTLTVISFSNDETARRNFGPFTPGFRPVPFGTIEAIEEVADENTVAVLLEPIQGEAGIVVPPKGFLQKVRRFTAENKILLVADEIQSGLGRTGATFACDHAGVVPDLYLLGKALGGGLLPVSAVVGNRDILGVLHPGQHGSTFGGNALASAVGLAVVELLRTGEMQERSRVVGAHLHQRLHAMLGHGVDAVRGVGLWAGVDIDPYLGNARNICYKLLARGVIAKDTHEKTIRLAPPLVITIDEVDQAMDALADALAEADRENG